MHDQLRRLEDRTTRIEAQVSAGLELLSKLLCEHGAAPALGGLHVREIHGKGRIKMATAPPIKMLDVERVLLAVTPRKRDGSPDPAVQITWTSSDPAQVGIEALPEHAGVDAEGNAIVIPATHEAWATTPLDSGAATITVAAAGYAPDTVEVSYAPGVPGSLNLSAGTPVPD